MCLILKFLFSVIFSVLRVRIRIQFFVKRIKTQVFERLKRLQLKYIKVLSRKKFQLSRDIMIFISVLWAIFAFLDPGIHTSECRNKSSIIFVADIFF